MTRHEQHERLRRTGFRDVVVGLAGKGPLRDGLDVDRATDVLLTVYGDATYHAFRTEHGWSAGPGRRLARRRTPQVAAGSVGWPT